MSIHDIEPDPIIKLKREAIKQKNQHYNKLQKEAQTFEALIAKL